MEKFTFTTKRAFLFVICLATISSNNALAADTCSDYDSANIHNQSADLANLSDNAFSDPTNCAFPQVHAGATTVNKGVTPEVIEKMLEGNPIFSTFNNPKGDRKKIISDLYEKTKSESVKYKIDNMRSQLGCKSVEIEYASDGPTQNIMNFKKSFTSNLSEEDLKKYHKIDISEYSKVGAVYTVKDVDKFNRDVEKFIEEKNKSDRPVYVCTEQQEMNFEANTPNTLGLDFSDSFVTGLPELNNEVATKDKVCSFIKHLKPECVKSVSVSTSSDRRSNCDRSKNLISKNGENECPYISGTTLGRNDFEKLSKDRADKLEKLILSCSGEMKKIKLSKDSSGARGDGSTGICPYQAISHEKYTTKIKSEYLKGGSSVADLNQNRYARVNIESTRALGCEGYGKEVKKTSTVSVKCIRIQAKCL